MEDLPHTTTTPHPGSAYLVPEKLSPVCQVLCGPVLGTPHRPFLLYRSKGKLGLRCKAVCPRSHSLRIAECGYQPRLFTPGPLPRVPASHHLQCPHSPCSWRANSNAASSWKTSMITMSLAVTSVSYSEKPPEPLFIGFDFDFLLRALLRNNLHTIQF